MNRWRGGPPDHVWWTLIVLQLVAIALQIVSALLRV